MVACTKVFVVVYMFVLTCSFTFFLFWLCKFQSVGPEIKPYVVPSKLDSRVSGIFTF